MPASTVSDPSDFSNAQKNNVSLGCPSRFTGMFPAKLRARGFDVACVTLGSVSVTSKSRCIVDIYVDRVCDG